MASLIFPRSFTKQPQTLVGTDYPGLVYWWNGAYGVGINQGRVLIPTSKGAVIYGLHGASTKNITHPVDFNAKFSFSGARTTIALARVTGDFAFSNYARILGGSSYNQYQGYELGLGGDVGAGVNRLYVTWYAVAHRMNGAGTQRLDSDLLGGVSGSYFGDFTQSTSGMLNVAVDSGPSLIECPCILVFNRYLQDSEVSELLRNPWQVFKPNKRTTYFDVPSFPVLTSLSVSNITSSGGRLTASA